MNKTDTRKAEAALTGKLDGKTLSVEDHLYAIHQVRVILDHEEGKAVQRGRREGMTWALFGEIFSTTRQAAQQKFGHLDD
jgi:hypothetical protein